MDVIRHPVSDVVIGTLLLSAGLYVIYLIGMGKGGTWGCALPLVLFGLIFVLDGLLYW